MKLKITLTLKRKIIGLAILAAVLPVLVMYVLIVRFQGKVAQKAEQELDVLANGNVTQIAKDVYVLCETAGNLIDRKVAYDIANAVEILRSRGGVSLAPETVTWEVTNQETKQAGKASLRKMLAGGKWLGQVREFATPVPVVDEVTRLSGLRCTIFQRMNENGDMLRVATTVENTDMSRAIGTFIPAMKSDGVPNPVVAAALQGKPFKGLSYVVSDWYITAYEPLKDRDGAVTGMIFVGEKLSSAEMVRKGIMGTQVGKTGYVAVLGGKGEHKGQYIISGKGERDGENILDFKDADGRFFIKEMIEKAITHTSGETFTYPYWWKNPGESAPREKIAVVSYFEPWDWVIFTTMYSDDYSLAKQQFQAAARGLLINLLFGGLLVLAAVIGLAFLMGGRLAAPLHTIIGFAEKIAAGNVLEAKNGLEAFAAARAGESGLIRVSDSDETAQLVEAFRKMTASLDSLIGKVQQSGIQVTTLATQIAASAQNLQATVSEQAASTREVTATSREISATSNDLVRTMDEVSGAASETADMAEHGQTILNSNSEVMQHLLKATGSISAKLAIISDKANKISTVGTTINKISDQTNLLSLNAAIEAEKAGEYGKGFSVVAREISRLADQTAIATQDIADMVKGMQSSVSAGVMEMDKFAEEVRRGVQEVANIGEQLIRIIDQVRSLGPRFDTVKDGMHNQDLSARQISEAIGQLAVAADQTKDSLLDFKQATERANGAVRELQKEVSRFRISV